jgi:beta-glucosidase
MNKTGFFISILVIQCLFVLNSCSDTEQTHNQRDEVGQFDYGQEIEDIISKMSVEEKVGQMTQINIDVISKGEIYKLSEPNELDADKLDSAINHYFIGSFLNVGGHTYSRKQWEEIITTIQHKATTEGNNIPIIYGIDAIHGVNYTVGATLFPQQIGQAATWNPELVNQAAAVTAYECRASGIPWNFSPVLDLGRQPLWSRFFETYGEDVYLAKAMTKAAINGYQGSEQPGNKKVAACMKHFLGYSVPLSGKDRTPAWIPETQLREYFLPTFQEAIDNNALTIMINSGELNGVPVHANHNILTKLLRAELKFKGLAVTDWEDIIKLYKGHRVAKNMREAVKIAVMAGIDMSMTPNDYSFNRALIDLVKTGEVPESRLNESCRRILWVKQQLGILDNPIPNFDNYEDFGSVKHKQIALSTAQESITLLKNDNQILPLSKNQNILVCGPGGNSLNILNGAWTHTWQGVDTSYNTQGVKTIFESIQELSTGEITYAQGSNLEERKNLQDALTKASKAELIVVCLGEVPCTEKPGDIEDLNIPLAQKELVEELSKLGKPIVLVMVLNRPRIVNEIEPLVSCIIQCYLPGDFGGKALAQVLFGEVNPSGKLPFTYPRHTGSLVLYDHKNTEKLDKDFGQNAFNPQWEFGYGLSYSQFDYTNLKINKQRYDKGEVINCSVDITNNSSLAGKEIVQVYISDLIASITPSVKRLRAFDKILIQPGETQTVEFEIKVQELAFVNNNSEWIVEPGQFQLTIKDLSADIEVY